MEEIASKIFEWFVENFFNPDKEIPDYYPRVIREKKGVWIVNYSKFYICILNVPKDELDYDDSSGVIENPFPAFLIGTNEDDKKFLAAIKVEGTCNYFASNSSSGMFAFKVGPKASFTVIDHMHEMQLPENKRIKYKVGLAFIIGLDVNEDYEKIKERFKELIDYSISVWRKNNE